jgi:photosystem II stability/assembly factor-like uncharacterized protein
MTGLVLLTVALVLQAAPPAGPASDDAGAEIFRLERESAAALSGTAGQSHTGSGIAQKADAGAFDPLLSDAMRNDAWLHDLCFIDAQRGWAVGDRGVIWHTDDGGRTWAGQDSGVGCSLRSVCFINEREGWAGGGFSHPYTHTSSGVLLWTRDGGRHWHRDTRAMLPALRQIRFFDEKQGFALGNSSAMFPGGVLLSHDGGRSWIPSCGGTAGWTTGEYIDARTVMLAGRNGSLATIRQGDLVPCAAAEGTLQAFRQMRLVAPPFAWLVGDGGLAMFTTDLGAHWQRPPALPRDLAAMLDFSALAVRGPKCWIAGSPGSRVLHSPDGGRTWQALPTPTRLPLTAMTFADDQHGWAAGAMGTIIATDDGGQTWSRQRAGGARAAILGLFGQEEDVPLELIARLSGNEGYLSAIDVLCRRDVETPSRDESHVADRIHDAVVSVGGCGAETAWQFPVRQAGLQLSEKQIVEGWDRFHGGRGLDELQAHVVRQIRLWQPEVIVTHAAGRGGDDAADQLIGQAVSEAIEKAADPSCFPAQIAQLGLEPWRVKKVYASLPTGSRGAVDVIAEQWAPRLGRSLADVAASAHALLDDRYRSTPAMLGFRPLSAGTGSMPGHGDFLAGIALATGGEARRQLTEVPAGNLEMLQRGALRRRHAQAILDRAEHDPQTAVKLLAQAGDLTRGLDAGSAAWIVYRLADGYAHSGHGDMAAEMYQLLLEQYPYNPHCRPALVWLVQYYASGEAAEFAHGAPLSGGSGKPGSRLERAVVLAGQIERMWPDLFAQPAVRFPLAAAYRQQGLSQQAQRLYMMQSRGADRDAWWACAQGEIWLAQPKGPSPKPTARCSVAAVKPRLDGKLDDAVWQHAAPLVLQSSLHDDADWPAVVMLAHDAEFLYIAVNCRQAPGVAYEEAAGPRVRDSDLSAHDRVDLLIDIDRDYATYYQLTIDHRGWTNDRCCGDSTWDPAWFVAARTAGGAWTAEAAIPLSQLVGRRIAPGTVWAIGVQRTAPGAGFQSWTTPAATQIVPEGFGHMVFE